MERNTCVCLSNEVQCVAHHLFNSPQSFTQSGPSIGDNSPSYSTWETSLNGSLQKKRSGQESESQGANGRLPLARWDHTRPAYDGPERREMVWNASRICMRTTLSHPTLQVSTSSSSVRMDVGVVRAGMASVWLQSEGMRNSPARIL
jgi:hypothetical protein